jgi:hypothetical protein
MALGANHREKDSEIPARFWRHRKSASDGRRSTVMLHELYSTSHNYNADVLTERSWRHVEWSRCQRDTRKPTVSTEYSFEFYVAEKHQQPNIRFQSLPRDQLIESRSSEHLRIADVSVKKSTDSRNDKSVSGSSAQHHACITEAEILSEYADLFEGVWSTRGRRTSRGRRHGTNSPDAITASCLSPFATRFRPSCRG